MRRRDAYLRALSRLPLLAACSDRELSAVAQSSTIVDRPSGHVFAREGARCDEFIVLVSGSVVVVRNGLPDEVMSAGDWWGDADLLAAERSSSKIVSLTDVRCLAMSRSEFLGTFENAPAMRRRVVRSLANAARGTDRVRRPEPSYLRQ